MIFRLEEEFLVAVLSFMIKEIYQKLCHCDFFQITAIKIAGNHMVSKEQISALSRVDIHSNLMAININQVKSLLESHPWIAGAEITRNWPNRLVIKVVNSWYTRVVGDQLYPDEKQFTNTNIRLTNDFRGRPLKSVALEPSGLLGPVTIEQARYGR